MDQQAKHYRRMKNAVWLYLYLLVNANRVTGLLMRKTKTISADMGVSRDMVIRWLNRLRRQGYIATESTGRYLTIRMNNWKPLGNHGRIQPQMLEISNSSGWKYPTPSWPRASPIPDYFGPKSGLSTPPKETIRNRLLNNETETMRRSALHDPGDGAFKTIGFAAQQELLAQELAKMLDDTDGIDLYRSYCCRYPEELIRKAMKEVKAVPVYAIKKGRGPLFNYLIQQYAKGTTADPGG